MSTLPIRIGLVDMTGFIDPNTMAEVASALNMQVTRDLPQYWKVNATVSYLADAKKVPAGVWPVQLVTKLPPGEGGFHLTKHNQPYARVIAKRNSNEWTIDASHEVLEMVVDPSGNRLQVSDAIEVKGNGVVDAHGQFEYLVEICDPCEADNFSYSIDGYAVSDFITPHYYDAAKVAGVRYSFTGAITRPREMMKGGYISFLDVAANEMKQILWVDPESPPELKSLGAPSGSSLRAFVEMHTRAASLKHRSGVPEGVKTHRKAFAAAALKRAKNYV